MNGMPIIWVEEKLRKFGCGPAGDSCAGTRDGGSRRVEEGSVGTRIDARKHEGYFFVGKPFIM